MTSSALVLSRRARHATIGVVMTLLQKQLSGVPNVPFLASLWSTRCVTLSQRLSGPVWAPQVVQEALVPSTTWLLASVFEALADNALED